MLLCKPSLVLKARRAALTLGNTGDGVCASISASASDSSDLVALSLESVDTPLLLFLLEGGCSHDVEGDGVLLVLGPCIGVDVCATSSSLLSRTSKSFFPHQFRN